MKSIICTTPGKLELIERADPIPAPGNSIIRVRRVGICGTDFHIFQGKHPYLEYPRVMGHEFSGEVVQTNSETGLAVGQSVVANPYIACGDCLACRRGRPNCCANIRVLGVHSDGAMQEYVRVPDNALIPVDGMSLDEAASVEFLTVGLHAVNRSRIAPGDNVLVVGIGPIGLGTAVISRLHGAKVTLLDLNQSRLGIAQSAFGFDRVVTAGPDVLSELNEMTGGDLFDLVFDATGNVQSIHNSFGYVGHGGSLCLISVVKGDITFSDSEFHAREMQIIGSRNSTTEEFRRVIEYIRNGDLPVEKWLTHRVPFLELPGAFGDLPDAKSPLIKAMVQI